MVQFTKFETIIVTTCMKDNMKKKNTMNWSNSEAY